VEEFGSFGVGGIQKISDRGSGTFGEEKKGRDALTDVREGRRWGWRY